MVKWSKEKRVVMRFFETLRNRGMYKECALVDGKTNGKPDELVVITLNHIDPATERYGKVVFSYKDVATKKEK